MKLLFNLFTLLLLAGVANGQVAQGGLPTSLLDSSIKTSTIKSIRLDAPNLDLLKAEDDVNDAIKGRLRIGTLINSNIKFSEEAEQILLEDGRSLFRLAVQAKDAQALNFYLKNFKMPAGDEFFIYNTKTEHVLGAYTSVNNTTNGVFSTEFVHGEKIILEYVQSPSNTSTPDFVIQEIGYAYRNVYTNDLSKDFGDSDGCEVNANCSEGDSWTDQKKAVIRILVKDGGLFWCTGTTINNERQDCTPYLITAEHCGQTASASDINQWVFYFQYEAPSCANPASEGTLGSKTVTGATLRAQSNDNGGDTGSDLMLLEFNNSIPSNYAPYFAGWSRATTPATSGVSIHHPSGDIKKVSTYSSTVTSISYGGIIPNTHWDVNWMATANGHGVTEPGSSGSGLFDQNGRLVGTLTGGAASCSATSSSDEYGKFSYHWTSNGIGTNRQLKSWLDPDNTGITTLDGIAQPCNTSTLSLESAPEVRIFPNPTSSVFVIKWSNTTSTYANVRILNIVGQEVGRWNQVANNKIISLDSYTNGVYLIELELEEQIVTKKLILNK